MEEGGTNEAANIATKVDSSQVQPLGDTVEIKPNESDSLPNELNSISKESETSPASEEETSTIKKPDNVTFKLVFNKQKHNITWDANETVASLKKHIEEITGVPPTMQKLMFKGLVKNDQVLSDIGVTNGSKMMLVGSKPDDVISIDKKTTDDSSSSKSQTAKKREPLSKQKPHLKITEQGIPEDAMPAYRNGHEPLPSFPLFNMMNKYGHRVRLTFKLETDQLWIGTKERTQKLTMSSIKDVFSEPISGHEEYHMLALQLGPTEQSRYWIYWVPAQYINAIKEMILGKFY